MKALKGFPDFTDTLKDRAALLLNVIIEKGAVAYANLIKPYISECRLLVKVKVTE